MAVEGGRVTVDGGRTRLAAPAGTIDLGNSGTGMRLLAGVVATHPRDDPTDRRRLAAVPAHGPGGRPAGPMGATVVGEGERCLPPLAVTGGALHGIDYTPPMASAQVKGAVLLAGLDAEGETVVREPVATRAHTEEMLAEAGADIDGRAVAGPAGWCGSGAARSAPGRGRCPGDPSQAAFWVVAGAVVPGSRITVEQLHLGAERIGFLHVLIRMGADVTLHDIGGDVGSVTAVVRPR